LCSKSSQALCKNRAQQNVLKEHLGNAPDAGNCRPKGQHATSHIYPGLPHGFFETDHPEYNPPAAELAWARTVDFFLRKTCRNNAFSPAGLTWLILVGTPLQVIYSGLWRISSVDTESELTEQEKSIWENLVRAYLQFAQASSDFTNGSINRAKIIKEGLQSKNRHTAIYFLKYLKQDETQKIFSELVYLASFSHGAIVAIREAILSLPRDWVLSRIETVAEPYLSEDDGEAYRRFLELYQQLDDKLMEKLAKRAVESHNQDIKEAGTDFLGL